MLLQLSVDFIQKLLAQITTLAGCQGGRTRLATFCQTEESNVWMIGCSVLASSKCSPFSLGRFPPKASSVLAMQVGLQVFSWAESQTESRKRQRERYSGGSESLSQEPMFCFERALKLLYFSALAYDIEEVSSSGLTLSKPPHCEIWKHCQSTGKAHAKPLQKLMVLPSRCLKRLEA